MRRILSSPGSARVAFPCFRFDETLRHPTNRPTALPFGSIGRTIPCACFRFSTQARRRLGARSFAVWQPPRQIFEMESPGLPGSQATLMHLCPVLRPRPEQTRLAEAAYPLLPPLCPRRRLQRVVLSGLNRTALVLAVYASPRPLLVRTQDSLPVVG